MFEGIAKTDTTYTYKIIRALVSKFEGIAKTDTTYTHCKTKHRTKCLRVLLKQTQLTLQFTFLATMWSLRVLLKQTQLTL